MKPSYSQILKLSQEKYNGSLTGWPAFWGWFENTVHHNEELLLYEKHSLLSSLIIGPARDTIAPYLHQEKHYKQAIRQLKRSYGNDDACLDAILRKFEARAPVQRSNVDALRKLLSDYDATLGALAAIKVRRHDYRRRLLSAVVEQVPESVRRRITEHEHPSFHRIRRYIDKDLIRLERTKAIYDRAPKYDRPPTNKPATRTTNAVLSSGPSPEQGKCLFCAGEHKQASCSTYSTYAARLERVKAMRICPQCLRVQHEGQCQRKLVCYGCGGKHFRSMCPSSDAPFEKHVVAVFQPGKVDSADSIVPVLNVCSAMGAAVDCPLLNGSGRRSLMTLYLRVFGPKGSLKIRGLLDDGADICLISRRVCQLANLNLSPAPDRRMVGAGGVEIKTINQQTFVPIGPLGHECIGRIRAYVIDTVTSPIPHVISQQVRQQLKSKGIVIDDCQTTVAAKSTNIDLLIGVDALMSLLTNKRIQVSSHLCAVETKLGWCVLGVDNRPPPHGRKLLSCRTCRHH